jgi:uncharacterized protein (UPF0335 family)
MDTLNSTTAQELKTTLERIERLTETKKDITADINDILNEAESKGFNKKAIRAVIKRRAADKEKLEELDSAVELYTAAVGE